MATGTSLAIDSNGHLALTDELRERLGVQPGQSIKVELTSAGLLLHRRNGLPAPTVPGILETLAERGDVPQEEIDRLPTDGAEQHDHYIYGTPKRTRG